LVTLVTTRLYPASTRLQLARQSPIQLQLQENVLHLDESARSVNGTSSFLATQVATLKSRDLAERVIRSERLATDEAFLHPGAERKGLLSLTGNLVNLLRPRGWDGAPAASGGAEHAMPSEVDPVLLDRYTRYLSVQDVRGTDLVEVSFTTPSPALSAFLAAASRSSTWRCSTCAHSAPASASASGRTTPRCWSSPATRRSSSASSAPRWRKRRRRCAPGTTPPGCARRRCATRWRTSRRSPSTCTRSEPVTIC